MWFIIVNQLGAQYLENQHTTNKHRFTGGLLDGDGSLVLSSVYNDDINGGHIIGNNLWIFKEASIFIGSFGKIPFPPSLHFFSSNGIQQRIE